MLFNFGIVCPTESHILINTYRKHSQLFVEGLQECTTQGDPLAMAMYAFNGIAKQVWFAGDSAVGWDLLVEIGPQYGYFQNGSKMHALAKLRHAEAAMEIFEGTGIDISTEGERYLDGAIGTSSFIHVHQFVEKSGTLGELHCVSQLGSHLSCRSGHAQY